MLVFPAVRRPTRLYLKLFMIFSGGVLVKHYRSLYKDLSSIFIIINSVFQKNIIKMIKFLTGQEITPKFKLFLKYFAVISTGAYLGYWKSTLVHKKYQNIDGSKLVQYENQDQINTLIQKTQKPAIIYYYFGMRRDHYLCRQYMQKYSNLYPNNCHWVMVNIKEKFQQAKQSFSLSYPLHIRLQVRYPKSNVFLKIGGQNMQKFDHRRVPFAFDHRQQSFKAFLQYSGIIKGADPVLLTLQTTNKALFHK